MSKKENKANYHKRTYIPKKNCCDVCNKDLTGTRRKRCDECKITCLCQDCGKIFLRRVKYKLCSVCSYKDLKLKNSEGFQKYRQRINEEYKKKTRERLKLPLDHDFGKAPKGTGFVNVKGYRKFWMKDIETGKQISRYEHHIVIEQSLGRELFDHERVHHKNGDRGDNRIENLELWSIGQPSGQRVDDKINYFIEFLQAYGYKVYKV